MGGVLVDMEVLRLVTPTHPAAAPLLAGLRHEYHQAYGPEVAAELDRYSTFEFLPPAGAFMVLEAGGVTLAGGALRRLVDGVGEIKRMWTAPEHRGNGYARRILTALEYAAVRRGYHTVRLQTGDVLHAAIELYRSAGYRPIDGFGPYTGDPRLRAFEKQLDGWDHFAADALDRREIIVREMLQHHALNSGLGKFS